MKEVKLIIISFIFALLIIPMSVNAEEYECSYKNDSGTVTAGYNTNGKNVFLITWGSKEVNKSMDSSLNHSKNKYKPDKCYNYICIYRKKLNNKPGNRYSHFYYLGNSQEDFSSSLDCALLSRKGVQQTDTILKKEEVKLTSTLINTRKLNFDVKDKPGNDVIFTFYTYANNLRSFCVNYASQTKCSNKFAKGSNGSVVSNVKNKSGQAITFQINGNAADDFFEKSAGSDKLDFTESGNIFSIGLNQKYNSVNGTTTVSASIKSNNNFICKEGDTLGKKDKNGNDILTFRGLLKKYWSWVTFLVPFALIGFISYDFIRAVTSNDSDAVKKSSSNAFKRVIAAILLLLSPYLVYVIMGWFGLTFCFY